MNKVILMGRVSSDLKIYDAVVKFNIAVQRRFKSKDGKQETDFFYCVAFGKTKEFIENWITKGTKVVIEGELRTNRTLSVDGQTSRTSTEIHVESIEFAESKKAAVETATVTPVPQSHEFTIVNEQTELPFK